MMAETSKIFTKKDLKEISQKTNVTVTVTENYTEQGFESNVAECFEEAENNQKQDKHKNRSSTFSPTRKVKELTTEQEKERRKQKHQQKKDKKSRKPEAETDEKGEKQKKPFKHKEIMRH